MSRNTTLKVFALLFTVLAVSASWGQELTYPWLTVDEQGIGAAFTQLRSQKEILLVLNGVDQFGPKTTALSSNAFFLWDPLNQSFAKAEINDYVNNVHTNRIVGDGTTLWSYSFTRNTYSSFVYGSFSGQPVPGFRGNMLKELTSASQGQTVFLARMLSQVFADTPALQSGLGGAGLATYTDWFAGATITTVAEGGAVSKMDDPVDPNRTYVADNLDYYVVYTYKIRPQRCAAFHFTRTDVNQPWVLSDINYADLQYINPSTPRLVDWTITVYSANFPVTTNFVFIPPASAKAIANVKGGS